MYKAAAASSRFNPDLLKLDGEAMDQAIKEITDALPGMIRSLKRRGVVIGLSGGIDSSVCAGLCAKTLGPGRVFGVFMPEEDSDPESLRLGRLVAEAFGIETAVEDIAPSLAAQGCYERRDSFIKKVVPEYTSEWKHKIVLPNVTEKGQLNVFSIVVQSPDGEMKKYRLPVESFLGIVAATNMKQRTRKQMEYYHADRLNFAVIGTPNRLEYDQGFFVKNGDGAADIKPIAHLYKTQVYQMADALGVPGEVTRRRPTTDTYSLPQSQDEFYFSLPYEQMDLALYALNTGVSAQDAGEVLGLSAEQVEWVFADIQSKRRATRYHHERPLLVQEVSEIHA